MSRIINRLVEASGGWEAFLYKTLRDVVDKVGQNGFTGEGENAIEDAQEILDAYEELDRQPDTRKEPVGSRRENLEVLDDQSVEIRTEGGPEKVKKVVKQGDDVAPAEDVEWQLEDLILSPPSRPRSNSRNLTGRVFVDKDLGGSSGELPMPSGHKLVNRQALTITTQEGMRLGEASAKQGEEDQVKSQHVTGHVSVTGKYRLVFVDTKLGAALIHYDVVALPSKMTSKQYKAAIAAANKLSAEELHERLEHFGLVYEKCLCGKEDCFGWRIIDRAEEVETEAQRAERLGVAARNVSIQEGMV